MSRGSSSAAIRGRRRKPSQRPGRRREYPLNVPGWKLVMKVTADVIDGSSPGEEPIRAELFGIERLEQHAESLAAAHRTTERPPRGRNLLPRVRANARVLLAGYRNIAETVLAKHEITPAAE